MTTLSYDGAFQAGLNANFSVAVLNELNCAGRSLAEFGARSENYLSNEESDNLSHILDHLKTIGQLCITMDNYTDAEIEKFNQANPGKLASISKEIGETKVIHEMQDAIKMTPEERETALDNNLRMATELDAKADK